MCAGRTVPAAAFCKQRPEQGNLSHILVRKNLMRAIRVTKPGQYEDLELVEEPVPELGRRDVLIKVRAASLNYRDTIIAKGSYPGPLAHHLVPLSDGAGDVVAIGSDVARVKVGDRVTANCVCDWVGGPHIAEYRSNSIGTTIDGMLAEYVRVEERAIVHLPDSLSYIEAASLPCAAVSAWSALHVAAPLAPGQTVLIQGTGGVSLFGLQIARMFGARVLALTSSEAKAEKLRSMGASAVINYRDTPEWEKPILDLTDGKGVDKVIEIGGSGTINHSVACTRAGGEIGLVGYVTGTQGGVSPIAMQIRSVNIKPVSVGPRLSFEALLAAMQATDMRPVIDSVFGFSDFRAALLHLESGTHVGKIAINMTD
ncbi:NAD(P)-dependent alcohol dehydrogenase [Sphingobium sp. CR2-8]|uniref:zinc-dependent alcohol dehydrogenase family protein n=1 Tax=Sphingobium sp. CR2-8 TaxID=1306534 RepID=UPI002DB899F3|nr:NAD(P)-dependent alcohol dehydrogenase [Sphingobium sp. CR2-8]MEC3909518.1 NAD(P)-dependent alcohol dehydrogenase [Sphingobium sp. CR2-8]